MSDDYDDEDEPGGLWDPDAFTPPPAPTRPALYVVATPPAANRLDRRVDASNIPDEADQHTLVLLEQFQTASDAHLPRRRQASRPILRLAAAAGMLASVAAAIVVAYGTPGSPERTDRPASSPRVAPVLAVDSEHAAATREVASAGPRARNARQPNSHVTHQTSSNHGSGTASHNRSATPTRHRPTVSASGAATGAATTVIPNAAPRPRHQTPGASATSEFGFEG